MPECGDGAGDGGVECERGVERDVQDDECGVEFGLGLAEPTDVWPGDALLVQSDSLGLDVQVVVRPVGLKYAASDAGCGGVCDRVFE